MRCILGLATAGLVILSGTAAADAQPLRYEPDPSAAQTVADPPPWPPRPVPLPFPLPPRPKPDPPEPRPPWGQPTPPRPLPPRPLPPRPIPPRPPWGQPIPPRPIPIPPPLPPRPPRPPWGEPIPPRPIPIPPRPPIVTPPIVAPPWGPSIGGPYAKHLTLTIEKQGRTRTVRLGCAPVYGSHPRGPEACALLGRAQGNPIYVRLPFTACPLHYDPVTVSATGTWNGRYVRYRRTFSNQCALRAATGAIFSF